MAGLDDFFKGGGGGEQLLVWGILNQLLAAAMAPAISEITQTENAAFPLTPLSAEQSAVATLRGIMAGGDAANEALRSGVSNQRFATLQALAASPPPLSFVLAAYQRSKGIGGPGGGALLDIGEALADLGFNEKYRPVIEALATEIPTTQAVMEALLEGQISRDEALSRYLAAGGDPGWFDTDYNRQGQAPTPTQALELLNRGIIPRDGEGPDSVSYHQAFLEGPWRNKWEDVFAALRLYLTPPRTVSAMLREGSIDEALATKWLTENGLEGETLAAYLRAASHTTTPAQRELTKTEVLSLYNDQLITPEQAIADLVALKYQPGDAQLLIANEDKKRAGAAVKQAVTRLQNLYLAGTNDAAASSAALRQLGLPDVQVANLIATWRLEQATVTRTLSEGQIVSAWYYDIFSADPATNQQIALSRLQGLGYSVADAKILMGTRSHTVVP